MRCEEEKVVNIPEVALLAARTVADRPPTRVIIVENKTKQQRRNTCHVSLAIFNSDI